MFANTPEEYDDDTVLIPRSTTVIARRLPATNRGQGRAARYVSGRMPANARAPRHDQPTTAKASSGAGGNISEALTEEEKIAAMFQAGSDQWEQQKQSMAKYVASKPRSAHNSVITSSSSATPVFRPNNSNNKAKVPDHPPPSTYTCHRCGQPGTSTLYFSSYKNQSLTCCRTLDSSMSNQRRPQLREPAPSQSDRYPEDVLESRREAASACQ